MEDVDMNWSPTHTPAAEGELQLVSEIFDVFEEGVPLFLPSLLFLSSPESAESPTSPESPESLASPLVLPSSDRRREMMSAALIVSDEPQRHIPSEDLD